jgi:hypothetical protein
MVRREGLAPPMEPVALRLKRPNRSLLREPTHETGAAGEFRDLDLVVGNDVLWLLSYCRGRKVVAHAGVAPASPP